MSELPAHRSPEAHPGDQGAGTGAASGAQTDASHAEGSKAPAAALEWVGSMRERGESAALDEALALTAAFPADPATWTLAGRIAHDHGQLPRALEAFSRAAQLQDRGLARVGTEVNSALVLLALGEHAAAAAVLGEAEVTTRDTPLHPYVLANLASALMGSGDHVRAETAAATAAEGLRAVGGEALASSLLNLGEAQMGAGSPGARESLEQVAALTSHGHFPALHARAHLNLAELLTGTPQGTHHTQMAQDAARHVEAPGERRLLRLQVALRQAEDILDTDPAAAEQICRQGAADVLELPARVRPSQRGDAPQSSGDAPQSSGPASTSIRQTPGPQRSPEWPFAAQTVETQQVALRVLEMQARACEKAGNLRGTIEALRTCAAGRAWLEAHAGQRQLALLQVRHDLAAHAREAQMARRAHQAAERKVARQIGELSYLATHDALTGLITRAQFERELRALPGTTLTVGMMDLDHFKVVNDSFGHHIGDALLREVAARLRAWLRPGELIARMGGDEFLLALPVRGDEAVRRTETLLARLHRPFNLDGLSGEHAALQVRASVGLNEAAPGEQTLPDKLIRHADHAMYLAKRRGGGVWLGQDKDHLDLALESALVRSAQQAGFSLIYQPIIELSSGRVTVFEALMRWKGEGALMAGPQTFIPILERCGLIGEVGCQTLTQAWHSVHQHAPPRARVSVNVSPLQLIGTEAARLMATLETGLITGLSAERLQLEVTESALIQGADEARAMLERLGQMGVHVVLDDFGSGYSNLGMMRELPLHGVKLDRLGFAAGLGHSDQASALVQAGALLGQALSTQGTQGTQSAQGAQGSVTLEGIETPEQHRLALSLGITHAQGWLYHRGLGAQEMRTVASEAEARASEANRR